MNLGQQLNTRREQFVVEEELEEQINLLYQECPSLHKKFRGLCFYFVNQLEEKLKTTSRDENSKSKQDEMIQQLDIIIALKTKLINFMNRIADKVY